MPESVTLYNMMTGHRLIRRRSNQGGDIKSSHHKGKMESMGIACKSQIHDVHECSCSPMALAEIAELLVLPPFTRGGHHLKHLWSVASPDLS
eukprot:CAMPEP_0172917216 /NCGR_PEP_ID=MMETSP1075-20121228/197891_1 /TAXON_ID=2916 /ORGANISM="Ceratium fusus, Strain PA161109" /LENGTH=91 /DNA_ID=CAMNT_0013776647 /DNA_START=25 /DNA_END=300 /DNA_ORIENTATION=-